MIFSLIMLGYSPRLFSQPRYHNLLLSAWELRYGGREREEGRELLERLCQDKYHLQLTGPVFLGIDRTREDQTARGEGEKISFLSVPEPILERSDSVYLNTAQPSKHRKSGGSSKKIRTVCVKPFNVKTVSPGLPSKANSINHDF